MRARKPKPMGFRDNSSTEQLAAYLRRLRKSEITPHSIVGTTTLFSGISRRRVLDAIFKIKGVDAAAMMRAHARLKSAAARQKRARG